MRRRKVSGVEPCFRSLHAKRVSQVERVVGIVIREDVPASSAAHHIDFVAEPHDVVFDKALRRSPIKREQVSSTTVQRIRGFMRERVPNYAAKALKQRDSRTF